jgi:hypothetical protein
LCLRGLSNELGLLTNNNSAGGDGLLNNL